jgi:hypothetical protein
MANISNINFINVRESYINCLRDSNELVDEYTKIMNRMLELKVPSSSSWKAIYCTKNQYAAITSNVENIKSEILTYEKKVNSWIDKATEIYFNTNFPPNLNDPNLLANYMNQQRFSINRIEQSIRDVQTLYTTINIFISEYRLSKDNAINSRRYQIGIVLAIITFLISLVL